MVLILISRAGVVPLLEDKNVFSFAFINKWVQEGSRTHYWQNCASFWIWILIEAPSNHFNFYEIVTEI